MSHWYGAQFEGGLLPLVSLTDHLRVTHPSDLRLLDAVAQYIERHVETLMTVRVER